jgi:hypothetical protein
MIISHEHKFIYFAPMKTATTSIISFLRSNFGAEDVGGRHDCFLPKEWEHYFTFASVRNPFHRALSGWVYFELQKNPSPRKKPIEQWVVTPWFKPMVECLSEVRVDAVVHVESLKEDLMSLPFVQRDIELPCLNCSDYEPATQFVFSPQLADIIRCKYRKDFEMFGYNPHDR